jgi:regulator of protease activity HflC (stomatin/prohibitin superfamily)
MADAPKVVANLGSVDNMISQVLEPAISSHFRNAAQAVQALDLYTKRAELQQKAKEHIQNVLKIHHIESKDTMIADVVLPKELTKTVTDRQIATQERATFKTQMEAQEERKKLENATAQADMQKQVVESERGVEISKNLADAAIRKADGDAEATKLKANADAENQKVLAGAQAEATKLKAGADAEAIQKTGEAEAGIILEKGKSTAEAYKLQVDAMGKDNFGQLKIIEQIAQNNMKLIPETLISGGGAGGGNLENMMGIMLLEKLTGKKEEAGK